MENNNYELLFEYLRKILYENDDEIINVTTLEEQYQRLGKGLQFLHRAVREMQTYARFIPGEFIRSLLLGKLSLL